MKTVSTVFRMVIKTQNPDIVYVRQILHILKVIIDATFPDQKEEGLEAPFDEIKQEFHLYN